MAHSVQKQIDQLETGLAFQRWLLKVVPWANRAAVTVASLFPLVVIFFMVTESRLGLESIAASLMSLLIPAMFYGLGRLLLWGLRRGMARGEEKLGALVQRLGESGAVAASSLDIRAEKARKARNLHRLFGWLAVGAFAIGIVEVGIGTRFAEEAFDVVTSALFWIVVVVVLLVARRRYGPAKVD